MYRIAVFFASLLIAAQAWAQDKPVDLELALGIDVSGSVDEEEAVLQRQGYISAFRHPDVIRAIEHGMLGRIAVAYYEWAGYGHMRIIADWTEISDAKTANAFADMLTLNPPETAHRTAIASAIDFGTLWFELNSFEGTRRAIDISGDGPNNWGEPVERARDRAVEKGVTINGLPIVNNRPGPSGRPQIPNLDLYYENCVIGGAGAFIVVANSFEEFAVAVRRKLIFEIANRMPPAPPARIIPAQLAPPDRIAPPCNVGERRWLEEDDF